MSARKRDLALSPCKRVNAAVSYRIPRRLTRVAHVQDEMVVVQLIKGNGCGGGVRVIAVDNVHVKLLDDHVVTPVTEALHDIFGEGNGWLRPVMHLGGRESDGMRKYGERLAAAGSRARRCRDNGRHGPAQQRETQEQVWPHCNGRVGRLL